MRANILVAEDDRAHATLIRRDLEREGHEVTVVHDGRTAIAHTRRCRPDLLVLELMLPAVDGLAVCRTLRSEQDVPIIMLTARPGETDVLHGLDVGADDCLTRPYRPRELLARVRAVLRRTTAVPGRAGPERHQVGGLVIDIARHQVTIDGRPVRTTPAEFAILACLAAAPGRVFTRELLLERAGTFGRDVTTRTVDTHMLNLRRKIEPVPARPRHLLTVHGVGYKLAEPTAAGRVTGRG